MAMNIHYTYSTYMTIVYNSTYEQKLRESITLESATEIAAMGIKIHGFDWADICDSNTGEVLAIVERS